MILKGHNGPVIDLDLSQTDEVIKFLQKQVTKHSVFTALP